MPKLGAINSGADADLMMTKAIPGNFGFSGVRIERLTESEYTLATVAIDISGSVSHLSTQIQKMLETCITSLQKVSRSEFIMMRIVTFNDSVNEILGFTPVKDIDPNKLAKLRCTGSTALVDATYSSLMATKMYADDLIKMRYLVNACIYIITDGEDNSSTFTSAKIKTEIEACRKNEELSSILAILIGLNDQYCQASLDAFVKDATLDAYISAGDVENSSKNVIGKIGQMISQSVSSSSQNLTGGGQSVVPSLVI